MGKPVVPVVPAVKPVVPAVKPVVPVVPAVKPVVPAVGPVIAALRSKVMEETKAKEEKGGGPVMNGTELMEAMKKVCKQDPKETLVLSDPTKQRDDEKMPCSDLNSGKKRSRFWGINPFVQTWALGSVGPTVASMSWPTVVQPVVPAVVPAVPGVGLGAAIAALRSKAMEETKVT